MAKQDKAKTDFLELIHNHSEKEKQRKQKLPRGLKIQKNKFLCAIGKAQPSLTEEKDEEFLQECIAEDQFVISIKPHRSLQWTDTVATDRVKQIIKEHQNFDLGLYLNCTKAIFLTYSGKLNQSLEIYKAFTYVLTHARLFDDSAKNMFELKRSGSFGVQFKDISQPLSDSVYMRKVTALIGELRIGFDEMKYRILNANVTYLTLLILRRFVRNETQFMDSFKRINTHDDYVKLCPHPLNSTLPRIGETFNKSINDRLLRDAVVLAIHAFLTRSDDTSKRILRVTCLQYVEWTGLQLPCLFFKVVRLYGIEEGELWNSLSLQGTYKSLFKLANDYYKQYKASKAEPPQLVAWFPYCRALDGDYHKDLSAAQNSAICIILAYLVDLKIGFDKSFVRNSHWAKTRATNDVYLKIAKAIYKKYDVPRLVVDT